MKIRSLQYLASFFICGATLFMTVAQSSCNKDDTVAQDSSKKSETVAQDSGMKSNTVPQDSGKKSTTVARDSGKKNNTVARDSGKKSNTVAPDSGKKSNTTAPDSGKKSDTVAPDSGKKSDTVVQDSGKKSDAVVQDLSKKNDVVEGAGQSGGTNARQMATDFLSSSGLVQGFDSTTNRFVAIGSATMPCDASNSEKFQLSRNATFERAMVDVKTQMAKYLKQEISTAVKSIYKELKTSDQVDKLNAATAPAPASSAAGQASPLGDVQIKAKVDVWGVQVAVSSMGADRALNLAQEEANNQNIDLTNLDAPEKMKVLLSSDSFSKAVEVISKQEVVAVQCFQSFESIQNGECMVAVIGVVSPKSMAMAAAILGSGVAPKGEKKESIKDWLNTLKTSGKLLYTRGIIQRADENGDIVLISFGQAAPRTDGGRSMDAAFGKATTNADGALRQFAGELLLCSSSNEEGYTLKEFDDRTKAFQSESAYEEKYKAVAQALAVSGFAENMREEVVHPSSNQKVAIVVKEWNLKNSQQANVLRQKFNDMRGSAGGKGATGN